MMRLQTSRPVLRAGDCINFYPKWRPFFDDPRQWTIDFGITRVSKCTHHGFLISDRDYIEANNPEGVCRNVLDWDSDCFEVYRPPLSDEQVAECIRVARKTLGHDYDVPGALWAGVLEFFGLSEAAEKVDNMWYCSEHLAHIFRAGPGIDMHPNSNQRVVPDRNVKYMRAHWHLVASTLTSPGPGPQAER